MTYRSLNLNYIFLVDVNYFKFKNLNYISNIFKLSAITNLNIFIFYFLNNLIYYYSLYLTKTLNFKYFVTKKIKSNLKNFIIKENIKLDYVNNTNKKVSRIALLSEKKIVCSYEVSNFVLFSLRKNNLVNDMLYSSLLCINNNNCFFQNSCKMFHFYFKTTLVKPLNIINHCYKIKDIILNKKLLNFEKLHFYFF